jgi:hypothetical protein
MTVTAPRARVPASAEGLLILSPLRAPHLVAWQRQAHDAPMHLHAPRLGLYLRMYGIAGRGGRYTVYSRVVLVSDAVRDGVGGIAVRVHTRYSRSRRDHVPIVMVNLAA